MLASEDLRAADGCCPSETTGSCRRSCLVVPRGFCSSSARLLPPLLVAAVFNDDEYAYAYAYDDVAAVLVRSMETQRRAHRRGAAHAH